MVSRCKNRCVNESKRESYVTHKMCYQCDKWFPRPVGNRCYCCNGRLRNRPRNPRNEKQVVWIA